jgi:hypothetical protein
MSLAEAEQAPEIAKKRAEVSPALGLVDLRLLAPVTHELHG